MSKNKKRIVATERSGIYYRSSNNDWTTTQEFMSYEPGKYICRNVLMTTGLNEFKIADKEYSHKCNFGADENQSVAILHTISLKANTNNNIKFKSRKNMFVDVYLTKTENDMSLRIVTAK